MKIIWTIVLVVIIGFSAYFTTSRMMASQEAATTQVAGVYGSGLNRSGFYGTVPVREKREENREEKREGERARSICKSERARVQRANNWLRAATKDGIQEEIDAARTEQGKATAAMQKCLQEARATR